MLPKALILMVCASLTLSPVAHAIGSGTSYATPDELQGASKSAEYIAGNYPGAVLMPVNLWGAVMRSGLYHIPSQTDLLTLLSFAGGPGKDAELDEVTIRRKNKSGEEIIQVNVRNLLSRRGSGTPPLLEPNDYVLIPARDEGISPNTLKMVTVLSAIVGVVLSGLAISDRFRSK
jgi:hypothetical protein